MREERSLSSEEEVLRYLSLDQDADGALSKEEVPARMRGLITRADANVNGIITREELEAMVKKRFASMQQRGGGRRGFPGPPPD